MAGRLKLIEMLPYANRREDATGDYTKFLDEVLQPELDNLLADVDRFKFVNDAERVDVEAVLDAMLADLGNPFETDGLTPLLKRRLILMLLGLYRILGTEQAIYDAVAIFTKYEVVRIISPSTVDAWDLDVDVLGDGVHPINPEDPTDFAVLGPSSRYLIFSFSIELDQILVPADEPVIRRIISVVKPAYAHFLGIVQPITPPVIDHVELGYSLLDDTWLLH